MVNSCNLYLVSLDKYAVFPETRGFNHGVVHHQESDKWDKVAVKHGGIIICDDETGKPIYGINNRLTIVRVNS